MHRSGPNAGKKRLVPIQPEAGHHLFSADDPDGTACPVCGWALVSRRAEVVIMFPIGNARHSLLTSSHSYGYPYVLCGSTGPRVRNYMRQPLLLQDLEYQFARRHEQGWIDDAYDGTIYKEFAARRGLEPGKAWRAIGWKMTNDPIDVDKTQKGSFTPVWFTPMSFSPMVRKKAGMFHLGMLLGPDTRTPRPHAHAHTTHADTLS